MYEAQEYDYNAILLDVMLPFYGWELLTGLARRRRPPLLMSTARDASADRVRGLDNSADDYLVTFFDPSQLLMRAHPSWGCGCANRFWRGSSLYRRALRLAAQRSRVSCRANTRCSNTSCCIAAKSSSAPSVKPSPKHTATTSSSKAKSGKEAPSRSSCCQRPVETVRRIALILTQ
ncbi:putative transcriptional regulatory protein YedW [Abditibacteriota bacterium]|nr:putative transcriptional regulatory protein YedW [Abditibacteriota bacterium]